MITVRQLTREDFGPIFQIWVKEVYRGATRFLYSREEHAKRTFETLSDLFNSQDPCFLGIEEKGVLVGAVLGYGQFKPRVYCGAFLWVHPARRNQNHGTTLVQLLHKFGKDRGYRLFATESPSNSEGIKRILKRMGFHQARVTWLLAEPGSKESH